MKVTLRIEKDHALLYENGYDVYDAETFGRACAHAWTQLRERRLARVTSVGALYEELNDQLLVELDGATFSLVKA